MLPANSGAASMCTVAMQFSPTNQDETLNDNLDVTNSVNGMTPPTLKVGLSGRGVHWVALSWTASTTVGATYNVYRTTATGGTCPMPNAGNYTLLTPSPLAATVTMFADTNSRSGITTYCYSVSAVDWGGETFPNPAVQVLKEP